MFALYFIYPFTQRWMDCVQLFYNILSTTMKISSLILTRHIQVCPLDVIEHKIVNIQCYKIMPVFFSKLLCHCTNKVEQLSLSTASSQISITLKTLTFAIRCFSIVSHYGLHCIDLVNCPSS